MSTPHDPYRRPDQPGDQPSQGRPEYGPPPSHPSEPQYPQYDAPQQTGYDQPGHPAPNYADPGYADPGYADPGYADPGYADPGYEQPPVPPAGRGRLRVLAAAAAVVVIGGSIATYVAVSSSSGSGGADSPQKAVATMVTDLDNSDLLGLLADLPPNERDAISKPFTRSVDQLKRNDVIDRQANLSKVNGIDVATSGLTYAKDTVTINDHVQIVELTGGTIKVNADALKLPFTSDVLKQIKSSDGPTSQQKTVSISDYVKREGHPVRIATQKVDGRWYPSLFYSIADNAATSQHLSPPAGADSFPAKGASSADEAVSSVIKDLLDARVQPAIELTSPDELQVLHDYGPLLARQSTYNPVGVKIDNLTFSDTAVEGGTHVALKSLTISTPNGLQFSLSVKGSCYLITARGDTKKFCADTIIEGLANGLTGGGFGGPGLTPAQTRALSDLFGKLDSVGVVATRIDGSWYLNPVRSYFDLSNTLLSGLRDGDGRALISLISR